MRTANTHRNMARCAATATLACVLGLGLAAPAYADTASDLAAARTKLEQIGTQTQQIYDELATQTQALDQTAGEITQKQQEIADGQAKLSTYVAGEYKTGGLSLLQVLTGVDDLSDMLNRLFYYGKVSDKQAQTIQEVKELKQQLTDKQAEQEKNVADTQKKVDELNAQQAEAQASSDDLSDFDLDLSVDELAAPSLVEDDLLGLEEQLKDFSVSDSSLADINGIDDLDLPEGFDLSVADEDVAPVAVADSFSNELDEVNAELERLSHSLEQPPIAEPFADAVKFDADDAIEQGDEPEFDFLSGADETATKLDLAQAYIDMGDDEGARDILGEVLSEGNTEQKTEAKEMLSRLT